jgi:catalase
LATSNGVTGPVLSRVFECWRNIDADLGKKIEQDVRREWQRRLTV